MAEFYVELSNRVVGPSPSARRSQSSNASAPRRLTGGCAAASSPSTPTGRRSRTRGRNRAVGRDAQRCVPALRTLPLPRPAVDRPRVREMQTREPTDNQGGSMMAATGKDHARVNLGIWNDDDWLDLSPSAQHLYLVLWTSPGLTYCGAGDWRPGKIEQRAAGWTIAAVEHAAAELSRNLFLLIDVDTEEFLLRSWMKHDRLWKQPHMAVSMANARADLASRNLRGVVVHEVQKIRRDNPTLGAWTKDAVVELLAQKTVDPASLPTFTPSGHSPSDPPPHPSSDPSDVDTAGVTVDPLSDPPSTPSPSPLHSPAPSSGSPIQHDAARLVRDIVPNDHPASVKTSLRIKASELIHAGTDPAVVGEALTRWVTKSGIGPGLLPALVSDVLKDRTGTTARRDPKSGLLVER